MSSATTVPSVSDVRTALRRSSAVLGATTDTPRLEAELLLAHVLGASRTALVAHPEMTVGSDETSAFERLVESRASGHPLPYLVGHIEFYDLKIEVTPEVLIPRPETEFLVDLAVERNPGTVVDIGTGSGCIAVALAVNLPAVEVTAVDISSAALAVAQRNAEGHGVGDRVHLVAGDVLSPRPEPVDLIVSNPPYVAAGERCALPVSVREYEPWTALDGGGDGLDVLRTLLAQAPAALKPGGGLLVEIGSEQGEPAGALAEAAFPEATVRIHTDLAGLDRVLEVQS